MAFLHLYSFEVISVTLPDIGSNSDFCFTIEYLKFTLQSFQKAKNSLTARIDNLDHSLDECANLTENTREEVGMEVKIYGFGFWVTNNRLCFVLDICNTTASRHYIWRFQVCSCCSPCSGDSIARFLFFLLLLLLFWYSLSCMMCNWSPISALLRNPKSKR